MDAVGHEFQTLAHKHTYAMPPNSLASNTLIFLIPQWFSNYFDLDIFLNQCVGCIGVLIVRFLDLFFFLFFPVKHLGRLMRLLMDCFTRSFSKRRNQTLTVERWTWCEAVNCFIPIQKYSDHSLSHKVDLECVRSIRAQQVTLTSKS